MTFFNKLLMPAILFFIQLDGVSQTLPVKFSLRRLQQDYEVFVASLKEGHPGLNRYTAKEKFDSLFNDTRRKIDHSMTEEEFYSLLTPLIAEIKCGHTKFHRAGKPDDRYPFKNDRLFPLKLYFISNRAYVLYGYDSVSSIPPASEVLAINNRPIVAIMRELRKYMTIDGDVQSALYEELNHSFNGYFATFMEAVKNYKITYKEGTKVLSANLPGVNHQSVIRREQAKSVPDKLPLRLEYPAHNIAVLTIKSFYVDESLQKFYPFIDSVFKDLKDRKITSLIIDVRNNEGGEEDWGGYLYSYLTDKRFIYYKKLTLTKRANYNFAKYAAMPPQLAFIQKFSKQENGETVFTKQKYLSVNDPQKSNFSGKVYMLINGSSFSVTTELASMMHAHHRATFVGEESGGAYYGNNSGVFAIVTLPNTKLNLGIPLIGFYSNVADSRYRNRGIMPDYEVKRSVYDVLNERDAVKEYTLNLIRKLELHGDDNKKETPIK